MASDGKESNRILPLYTLQASPISMDPSYLITLPSITSSFIKIVNDTGSSHFVDFCRPALFDRHALTHSN